MSLPIPCIIKANGQVIPVTPANGHDFDIKELNGAVGGYIEVIPMSEGRYMVLNEDGKGRGLPENPKATEIMLSETQVARDDYAVGDVLICFQRQIR